jgi:hypothetical protein
MNCEDEEMMLIDIIVGNNNHQVISSRVLRIAFLLSAMRE